MDIIQDVVKKNIEFLQTCEDSFKDCDKGLDNYFKEVVNFINTENVDFFKRSPNGKENAGLAVTSTNQKRGRRNKPVLADITEINLSSNSVSIKTEKISDVQDASKYSDMDTRDVSANIKKEREEMPAPTILPPRRKKIRCEKNEPTRCTRSKTRTNKQDVIEDVSKSNEGKRTKNSDVIIQNTTITTIEISDTDKDSELESDIERNPSQTGLEARTTRSKIRKQKKLENVQEQVKNSIKSYAINEKLDHADNKNTRITRTKTKQKKRTRTDSFEEPILQMESKRSRSSSNTEQECNGSIQTEYEDAVSLIENNQDKNENINVTYVASKNSQDNNERRVSLSINSTVIVENPKVVTKTMEQVVLNNKVSKDESSKVEKSPELVKKTKSIKQVFSPFEKTPLKKKVEAFERLGIDTGNNPTILTRTKTRTQKKNSKSKEYNVEQEEKGKLSEKPKTLTPLISKFQPKVCSTSRINKLHPSYGNDTVVNNDSILSVKSASALKASQAEFREREKRRQEKEREALRKREALLQAQTEEKRRKREEKQQKAQQQREMLEKEKQRQLEAQRIKEEKYKQAMAEREEKLQRQKEEAEKKRAMVKKKANEIREKEEGIKLADLKTTTEIKSTVNKQNEMAKLALKQKMERQQQPLYMITKPPLLPTNDCYDSDDPEYDETKRSQPYWSRDSEITEQQLAIITIGEQIKNTFFCRQAHTPDLQEIFEIIDPRKLKRTSSAIWRKPPRYTLMPTIEDQPLFSEESD